MPTSATCGHQRPRTSRGRDTSWDPGHEVASSCLLSPTSPQHHLRSQPEGHLGLWVPLFPVYFQDTGDLAALRAVGLTAAFRLAVDSNGGGCRALMNTMSGGGGPFLSARGTADFRAGHRVSAACSLSLFLFFSKGNTRETKGNFCSWFPRQRSLLMAGCCFQHALVSGQSELGFFPPIFVFQISEQKELMLP